MAEDRNYCETPWQGGGVMPHQKPQVAQQQPLMTAPLGLLGNSTESDPAAPSALPLKRARGFK